MAHKPFFTFLVIVVAVMTSPANSSISTSPDIEDDDNSFIAAPLFDGILKYSIRNNTSLPGIIYSDHPYSLSRSSLSFDWRRQTFFHLSVTSILMVPLNATTNQIKANKPAKVKTVKTNPMAVYFEHVERFLYVFYDSDKSITRFDPYIGDEGQDLILKLGESDVIYTLVVDPCESMMYWTNGGRNIIQRASTRTGLNRTIETIVGDKGLLHGCLTIDPITRESYWCDHDGVLSRIMRSDLHGKNRMIIKEDRRQVIDAYLAIAVTKEFIYYRPGWSLNLYRIDRTGTPIEFRIVGERNTRDGILYVSRQIESRNECAWRPDLDHWNSQAKQKIIFGLDQQNRSLSCAYTNAPNTTVKWLYNDKNIDLDLVPSQTMSSVSGGKSESLITIRKTRLSDEGNYTCQVSNRQFQESVEFMVEICSSCVPKIHKSEGKNEIFDGTGARTLACKYNATSRPNVTWTHNAQEKTGSSSTYNGTIGESVILLTKINFDDDGIYTCSVENEFGKDFFEIDVQIVEEDGGNEVIFALAGAGIVILVLILLPGFLWRKHNDQRKIIINLTDGEIKNFYDGQPETQVSNPNGCGNITALAMPFDQKNEIFLENLIIGNDASLGQGQFGIVLRGSYQERPVAVKTVKLNSDVAYLKALLSEIKIMAFIGNHKAIVEFLGAHTSKIQENVVYLVVELRPFGDLHSYLQQNRLEYFDKFTEYDNFKCPMSQKKFVNWSMQIAGGMKYLEERKVVHADLATRNILMFPDDVVKISDFGLSRQLYGYTKYVKKSNSPLPFRWMALESLSFMEFTSQSDVWSFGVTIWEIFSLGQVPYPQFTWSSKFVQLLGQGLRLSKPDHATFEIYGVMLKCWETDPKKRSSFEQLLDFFQTKLHDTHHQNLQDTSKPSCEGRYIESEDVLARNVDACPNSGDQPSAPLDRCLVFTDESASCVEFGENTATIYISV